MRALSLHQPWASLMAVEAKRNETRGRPLAYVGELAIHAAKFKFGEDVPCYAQAALTWLWSLRDQFPHYGSNVRDLYYALPFGAVVCVVDKTGCVSTDDDNGYDRSLTEQELQLGDYSPGRFYYPTTNCRRLIEPVKCNGRQGLFTLPTDVEALIRAKLKLL